MTNTTLSDTGVTDVRRQFIAQPVAVAIASSAALSLADEIARDVRLTTLPLVGTNPRAAARVILSRFDNAGIDTKGLNAILADLKARGLIQQFFRLAHPRNSSELAPWLAAHGIGWSSVLEYYEWQPSDSLDVFFGVVAGVFHSLYEDVKMVGSLIISAAEAVIHYKEIMPKIRAVLDRAVVLQVAGLYSAFNTALSKGIAAAPAEYLRIVIGGLPPALNMSGAFDSIKISFKAWMKELEDRIMRLEFFQAGMQIGNALGLVLSMIEAGIGFVKIFPKLVGKSARAISSLPARLKAIRKSPNANAEAKALSAEFRALDGLDSAQDITATRKLPPGVARADLHTVIKRGGSLETKNGTQILWVDCPL
jgi:hypothetical protein